MKKVKMSLIGLDGNAFALMGDFSKNAKRQDWSKEEINKVLEDAMSGDYNHLISVLSDNIDDL